VLWEALGVEKTIARSDEEAQNTAGTHSSTMKIILPVEDSVHKGMGSLE